MKKFISIILVSIFLISSSFNLVANSQDIFEDPRFTSLGMRIRIPEVNKKDPVQGMRFESTISLDLYNKLVEDECLPSTYEDKGVGFGTVLLPSSYIPEGEKLTKDTEDALIVPAVNHGIFDSVVKFNLCLTEIGSANYSKSFTYVPYATYMENGEEITVYGEEVSASVFEIAVIAYEGDEEEYTKEYLNDKILNVVDPIKYPHSGYIGGIYRP